MLKRGAPWLVAIVLSAASCGDSTGDRGPLGAAGAGGGHGGTAGASNAAGASGAAGAGNTAGANGGAGSPGAAGAGGAGAGGTSDAAGAGGAAGSAGAAGGGAGAGVGGAAGQKPDAGADVGAAGSGVELDGGGPSFIPAGYKGTPFTALRIPGRINACDYDRGGAGVGYCHSPGNCGGGTVTGDYPQGAPVYRPPMPATAKVCSGAACDDNVGVCRMNPSKPDKIDKTNLAPAGDTYLCYTQAGTWTKYTVVVEQAGTYAIDGFMAVPQGGAMNISFSATITTKDVMLPVSSPVDVCGGGEYYHCWIPRQNLATVTFPEAGTYVMTLTQVGRFNADNFTFTKM
jgi:hypothetical protein